MQWRHSDAPVVLGDLLVPPQLDRRTYCPRVHVSRGSRTGRHYCSECPFRVYPFQNRANGVPTALEKHQVSGHFAIRPEAVDGNLDCNLPPASTLPAASNTKPTILVGTPGDHREEALEVDHHHAPLLLRTSLLARLG